MLSEMNELLFEGFQLDSIARDADFVFSAFQNGICSGVIVSASSSTTTVVPLFEGKCLVPLYRRICWGGEKSLNYFSRLVELKFPKTKMKARAGELEKLFQTNARVAST